MSDQFEATTEEIPAAPPLSERFADLIVAPTRAMAGVAERPAWIVPFLIIFGLMFAFGMATMHITGPEQQEAMATILPAEQQDAIDAKIDQLMDPSIAARIMQGSQVGLGTVLFAIMIPALLIHLFSRLSSGQGKVSQTLGVVYWAALVAFGLKTIISWVIIVLTGTGRWATLSLQMFIPDQNPFNPLVVLSGFWGDPLFYWTLWLAVIGVATVHRLSLTKALVVVGAVHVLLSGLILGIVLIARVFLASLSGQ